MSERERRDRRERSAATGRSAQERPRRRRGWRRLAYAAPAIVSSFFISPASAAPSSQCNPSGGPCMPTMTPCTPNG